MPHGKRPAAVEIKNSLSLKDLQREGLGKRACELAFLMHEKRNPTHNR